jgi:hypothetical protein
MIEKQFASLSDEATARIRALQKEPPRLDGATLLMFSGGRDSTIAAARLARQQRPLILVTVSSDHLVGIDRVRRRLQELSSIVPAETPWLVVRQPSELRTDTSFYEQTCLPCHHAYVVISGVLARLSGVHRLAFGYTGYQSDWPEQTPLAIGSLMRVLAKHQIELELPVEAIRASIEAIHELLELGLTTDAMEQKCLRQVSNVKLEDDLLRRQIRLWEEAIDRSMAQIDDIKIEVLEESAIGSLL